MKKCQVEMMKRKLNWMQRQSRRQQRQAEFSLCIAKISQELRKFLKDCENFATIAKFSQSLRKFLYAHFFAKLAKITVHSENLNFAMPCFLRYDSKISLP